MNLRPLGPERNPGEVQPFAAVLGNSQTTENKAVHEIAGVHPLPANTPIRSPFVTSLLQAPAAPDARKRPAGQRLLSVAQVAALLGLSRATVYSLIATGALSHLRISNAIRVEAAVLDAFIAAGRRAGRPTND